MHHPTAAPADRALAKLRRRLEAAELDLLRRHVVELDARIEELTAQVDRAERRAESAERTAALWHEQALGIMEGLHAETPPHRAIGLTRDGALLVVDTSAVN